LCTQRVAIVVRVAGYSGPCEIACAGSEYTAASASLVDDDTGNWFGRLNCGAVDWFTVELQAVPVTIRLPSGASGTVTVSRFTYLLPTQATVTGVGPRPW
jgi:hypothetical protein